MDVQVKEALIKALIAAIVGIAALIIVLLIYIIKSKYKQKTYPVHLFGSEA